MSIPPDGWVSTPSRADFVRYPLPVEEELFYTDGPLVAGMPFTQPLLLTVRSAGTASAEAIQGFNAQGERGIQVALRIGSAYGVVLVDSFTLTDPALTFRAVYSEVDGDGISLFAPLAHTRGVIAAVRAPALLAVPVSQVRTVYSKMNERSRDVS